MGDIDYPHNGTTFFLVPFVVSVDQNVNPVKLFYIKPNAGTLKTDDLRGKNRTIFTLFYYL